MSSWRSHLDGSRPQKRYVAVHSIEKLTALYLGYNLLCGVFGNLPHIARLYSCNMKQCYYMVTILFLMGCATQNSSVEKLDLENASAIKTSKTKQAISPPAHTLLALHCSDGRVIGWPYDCRTNEDIRLVNGNTTCSIEGLRFDPQTNSCV